MFDNGRGMESRMWTKEDQERADAYAVANGIGFHNSQKLKAKNANKKKARLANKRKKQSRKNNR